MKKETLPWAFAVLMLVIVLIVSIILGVSGYYFSLSYLNSNSDLVVGDTVSIGVKPNQANVASFTFDGGYMPNEKIPQVVQINATVLDADVKVRVKAQIFGKNQDINFDFVTTEHFELAEDGYYYYDDVLTGGNKITFCNYIVVPDDLSMTSKEKYILTFVVETLESDLDVENIWKNVQQV